MKTNAKIIVHRGNKEITIYIEDGYWNNVPDVRMIADVEVRDISDTCVREYESPVRRTDRSGKTVYDAYVESLNKNNDFLRPYGPLGN